MALWIISPIDTNKSVSEIQTWTKYDYQLCREEIFDWASFSVNSDAEPLVDLENPNGYLVNHDPAYSWSLENLSQTQPDPTVTWKYPENISDSDLERLKNIVDRGYIAIDADGWQLTNTDFWLYGPLVLINQDIGNELKGIEE